MNNFFKKNKINISEQQNLIITSIIQYIIIDINILLIINNIKKSEVIKSVKNLHNVRNIFKHILTIIRKKV